MTAIDNPQRVLIVARLSQLSDPTEASRIERDDEAARQWADDNGHTVVATVADVNVSGSTDPFTRDELGPWLTDPVLIANYDMIVASDVDRIARSIIHVYKFRQWIEEQGKTVYIQKRALSWPATDTMSGMLWDLLAMFAKWELDAITERIAGGSKKVRANRAFQGRPPWGFNTTGERYHKALTVDPEREPYLLGMIWHKLQGDTFADIALWLDAEGVATSTVEGKGASRRVGRAGSCGLWSPTSVRQLLTNQALKGRYVNAQGQVTYEFDGLISADEFAELQAVIEANSRRHGAHTEDTALLTGVVICDKCGGPMYRTNSTTTRKDGTKNVISYYRCKGIDQRRSICKNGVRANVLEVTVHTWFMSERVLGGLPIVERTVVAGADHTALIAEVDADIKALDPDAVDYDTRHAALRAKRIELRSRPTVQAVVQDVPTGLTMQQVWPTLTDAEHRDFLQKSGWKIRASNSGITLDTSALDPSVRIDQIAIDRISLYNLDLAKRVRLGD